MTRQELLDIKKEKETLREKLQATFHQVNGQILLIDELIAKIDKKEASQPK